MAAEPLVDLRSDTVTRPTPEMRAAMTEAAVGDDVYGEDPTVDALERATAAQLGKAAGVFFPSGTQSNLAAMLAHCGRGEEVLAGRSYHVIRYEAAGASVLGGLALQAVPVAEDGGLDPGEVTAAVKAEDPHFPVSRLLSLENTTDGRALPPERLAEAAAAGRAAGLSIHLDGARIFNAAVALDRPAAEIAAVADSVSVCLSKGLGAPVGSVLCAEPALADKARRLRKMLGGGMRQAGVIAAAGLVALERQVARLAQDHARAAALAAGLDEIDAVQVERQARPTNMVYIRLETARSDALIAAARAAGVLLPGRGGRMRLAVHLDIDDAGIDRTIAVFRRFFAG